MTTKRKLYEELQFMVSAFQEQTLKEFEPIKKFVDENNLTLLPSYLNYDTLEADDLLTLRLPCVHAVEEHWSSSTISCNDRCRATSDEEDHYGRKRT